MRRVSLKRFAAALLVLYMPIFLVSSESLNLNDFIKTELSNLYKVVPFSQQSIQYLITLPFAAIRLGAKACVTASTEK
jgi:hypothetical protein